MKKILIFAAFAALIVACDNGQNEKNKETIDSLTNANAQLKNGYDDLIATINQINSGFSQIVQAEDRINNIAIDQNEEVAGAKTNQNVMDNMEFIVQILDDNKEKIKALEDKLADNMISSEELKKMVDALRTQLEAKQQEVLELKRQLEEKNYQIGQMGQKIDNLVTENTEVKNENEVVKKENTAVKEENTAVKEENAAVKAENTAVKAENQAVKTENEVVKSDNEYKTKVVESQDAMLNTAYYVFGTKAELKEHKIMDDGDVLTNPQFDQEYFTKIDIRTKTSFPLGSKYAKILSKHPNGSYTLLKDSKGEYTLKINTPSVFWSTSKYLVVRVK